MQPENDHETAIAKAIDSKLLENPNGTFGDIILAVAGSIGFPLSKSESEFLLNYAKRCLRS